MKIVVISTICGCRWAGSEELWYGAALKALAAGHSVATFVHQDLGASKQIQELTNRGAEVHLRRPLRFSRLWTAKEKIAPTFPLGKLSKSDVILLSLGSLLDLFHVPGLLASIQQTNTKFVLLCQFNADGLAFQPAQRSILKELVARSAGCCFVSRHNLDLAERQLAIKLPGAAVISNPVRTILPEPLPWPNGETTRFACVARLETLLKGQDLLMEILSKDPWPSRDWTFNLFGEGPDLEHLQRAARFFGLDKRIGFRGYVRDLGQIWSDHHIMVLPSRGEGLPLAILEAMMSGRLTITTDVGGNREILEDSQTGFIADAATPRSFGDALERAWGRRSDWQQMGMAAHQRARQIAASDPERQLLDFLIEKSRNTNNRS